MQFPPGFLDSLNGIKGFNRESFERVHHSGESLTSIRLNPFKPVASLSFGLGDPPNPIPWCATGFYLPERPSFTLDPLFHAGCYYVQEASSMFLEAMIDQVMPMHARTPYKVLDLCAAPGGKSTHLSTLFPKGFIVANEVNKLRVAILTENAIKWGRENLAVTNNDPADFKALEGYFDTILVDAPCSGSGLFRKDEDAIGEWSLNNVRQCSNRQRKILEDIWTSLKEDGFLIYSTCSYSAEEDEDILDWMLDKFEAETCRISVARYGGIVELQTTKNGAWAYRFFPDLVKGEGFFISCVRKKSGRQISRPGIKKSEKLARQELKTLQNWVTLGDEFEYCKLNGEIHIVRREWLDQAIAISSQLYFKKIGVYPGKLIGTEMVPDHQLALSSLVSNKIPAMELSMQEALQYLRKESLPFNASHHGWTLVKYRGINIGWVKALANRTNNYYPKEWRILKS